jgi:retron-type reverse transcriptase
MNIYKFKPSKIVKILKSNSEKLKQLIISGSKDKIIQKAMSIIINQIYEYKDKTFLDVSHGFRPRRSTHTILKEIKTKWTGLYWFVEAEIEKIFEKIQRNILINLLNKKIKDQKLTDLIRKMFNCRVLAPNNFFFKNNTGVSEGNVLSPLLCNIYLHELDIFMTNLIKKYYKGNSPTVNKEYYKILDLNKYERTLTNEIQNSIKRAKRRQLFNKGIKPYLHDGNYIRMRYVRYADDFLVGIRAPKSVVKKIKIEITNWLKMTLHLNLNEKKTNLKYIIGNKVKFLGFSLYNLAYNQMPFRNSRQIEKFKRVKRRILAHKKVIEKKLSKHIRIDLIKIIKKKLKIKNTKFTKKVVHELSDVLVNILGDEGKANSKYREILRELGLKLTEVIINDTNENLKKILGYLINPKLLNLSEINENPRIYFMQRDTSLISKIKLPEVEFVRRLTNLLKINGYEHYKDKVLQKRRFDKNTVRYLKDNNIKFTYYPIKVILPEKIKNKLIKTSKNSPKRGALATNYKTLINYF